MGIVQALGVGIMLLIEAGCAQRPYQSGGYQAGYSRRDIERDYII
jgi:hypothetical protein